MLINSGMTSRYNRHYVQNKIRSKSHTAQTCLVQGISTTHSATQGDFNCCPLRCGIFRCTFWLSLDTAVMRKALMVLPLELVQQSGYCPKLVYFSVYELRVLRRTELFGTTVSQPATGLPDQNFGPPLCILAGPGCQPHDLKPQDQAASTLYQDAFKVSPLAMPAG